MGKDLIEPKIYWVGFNLVRGIGAARMQALMDHFGDVGLAWHAPADALRAAGLGTKVVENFLQVRSNVDLELVWQQIQARGIKVVISEEVEYPVRLKEIELPPPVLYVQGDLQAEDEWAVAIVGTRRLTAYGRQVTTEIASMLARSGVSVVSGLARGIDGVAHKAALEAGGRTLAVLGSGVDRIYPPEHRKLAGEISRSGALISDYAPGTPPDGLNFPPRNRIIAGLSLAVVVVEAGESSGALITAKFAADQGREVFAVPGSITAPQSQGTNKLIQQGASPLLDPAEVLEALNLRRVHQYQAARKTLPADETELRLLNMLSQVPMHVDEISNQTDLPIEIVSATLTMLELKGLARQVGGMNYIAVRELEENYGVE
ncbi:MAG: DNA-processing protein DprA [Anaerolineales bacterium]|nr:MAG: DNA-processing protein DprA [Anaerolineales bacterium]